MALFRAVREIVWQWRLLAELGEEQQEPTPLYCDSQGTPLYVTFNELVPFYRLFSSLAPAAVLCSRSPSAVGSVAAQGAASRGAEPGGAGSEGAETGGAEPGGAQPEGVEPEGAASEGAESGATGAGGAGAAGARAAGVAAGASGAGGAAATGPGSARTRGTGAAGTGGVEGAGVVGPSIGGVGVAGAGVGGTGARGTGAVDPCAGGAGGSVWPRSYFVPLIQQVLGTPSSTGLTPPLLCPPPCLSQPPLQLASPLRAPSPYTEQSGGLTERREPASRPVSPVCTARCVPRSRPPLVPGMHAMALRPSSVPLPLPLPAPPESSLPKVPDPESDRARTVSHAVSRLLATAVTHPSFESVAASALAAEFLDFATACRLDYATALEDVEFLAAAVPHFASMLLVLEGDPDAPDIPTTRSYAEVFTGPYSSQWQAAMDAEMASWKSKGICVDKVPPPVANIVDGIWIFRGVDYVATRANTADVFTKALPPGDHQRFVTV
ncbi:unnamed protein product [Closterium sp. NIES-53]